MNPEQFDSEELLALLASSAELEMKARACQQLAVVGQEEAVPALAALLADDALCDYARYALEAIESPEAEVALRKALPTLEGRALAGAIDSLGVRRDGAAVSALVDLTSDSRPEISTAALSALGKIASDEALRSIQQALANGSNSVLLAAAHAALAAAATLNREGRGERATVLIEAVGAARLPEHLLSAARAMSAAETVPTNQVRIFDGKTFEGWDGNLDWFRIAKGAVIAGSKKQAIPQNEFLRYNREVADFELRLKVRMAGAEANGGIQFRSQRIPDNHEMIGYQADVAAEYWGGLYDESRRSVFLGKRAEPAIIAKAIKPKGWNDYLIRCEGPRVRLWLNGQLATDFTEADAAVPRSGFIALQIHSGPPSEVWYKDIRLAELLPVKRA